MFAASRFKVYLFLSIVLALTQRISADESEPKDDSKFKYGYVISHKEGSTQAHVEFRDGEMALGRYYVNHPNGSGQKVTYFADDLGFHSGVSYTNRLGKGSSKTEIAMGPKAIAALADFDAAPSSIFAASTAVPLHGVKITQKILEFVRGKPEAETFGKLSYPTGTIKGFYLTKEPLTATTKISKSVSEYSEQTSASLNQRIQATTPSVQTFSPNNLQNDDGPLVETIPSYVNQKSIEKTHFNNDETHLILEVQKHAESVIRKDLAKGLPSKYQIDNKRYSPTPKTIASVTMQPIVITDNGLNNVQNIITSTRAPAIKKLSKDLHPDSINALKITEKNNKDQTLEDTGYFKVSLSPSFVSSINTSQSPAPSINIKPEGRNLNSSSLCNSNLCDLNKNLAFSDDVASKKPKKDTGTSSEVTNTGASQKVTQTFYPESQVMSENHYITTIDIQKGISLDVRQMEDGSIRLANNFESNKISSRKQPYDTQTIRPILSNSLTATPSSLSPTDNVYFTTADEKSGTVDTVTQSPAVFGIAARQNIHISPSLNAPISSFNQYQAVPSQNEIPTNTITQKFQYFQTASPEPQYNHAKSNLISDDVKVTEGADELRELQRNIQELRQKILNDVDAKHEEERRKQKFNENERKEYMENLKKVEEVKEQKPLISYTPIVQPAQISVPVQATGVVHQHNVSPVIPVVSSPVQNVSPVIPVVDNSVHNVSPVIPVVNNAVQNVAPVIPVVDNSVQNASPVIPVVDNSVQNVPSIVPAVDNSVQTQNNVYSNQPTVGHIPTVAYSGQQIQNPIIYQQPIVAYATQGYQNFESQNERKFLENSNLQTSYVLQPSQAPQTIQLTDYVQTPAVSTNLVTKSEVKPEYVENFLKGHSQTLSFNAEPQLLAQETNLQYLTGNSPLVNSPAVQYDYNSYFNVREPVSYLNNQEVQVPAETQQIASPAMYQFPQQLLTGIEVPQPKLNLGQVITYPENPPITNQPYHVTVSRPDTLNKLRIQPLKPSPPDESAQTQLQMQTQQMQIMQPPVVQAQALTAQIAQAQAVQAQVVQPQIQQAQLPQNLLPPSQFQQTYFIPSYVPSNRLHLRHIKKNRNMNSDQVAPQSQTSVTRKAKALSNLRIEYGFKPPLRPSVEYTEEVKPSIYGPSTRKE